MPRCGCQDQCSCAIRPGQGISVTGNGAANNPYALEVNGAQLTSQGIAWDATRKRFSTKLAGAASGLAFDGAGGLFVTKGEGGGGGTIPGASVAELVRRVTDQNIVGGVYGAGYMIKPQCTRGSFTYGVQRGLDLMHVPVRFLHDGTPVVTWDEFLGKQNGDISDAGPVLNQDIHRWRLVRNQAGIWNPDTWNRDTAHNDYNQDPRFGWFGYLEPSEQGLLSLPDVFDVVGRSCVLLLDLMFPPITDDGSGNTSWDQTNPPTDQQVASFLDRIKVLIARYGLAQSVIVTTATPFVPHDSGTPVDVLKTFYNASITVGPMFPDQAHANTFPPDATWPEGWTWAFMGVSITADTTKRYVDQGTHCLYYVCNRQYFHEALVKPSGAAGALSGDPEYYAGAVAGHPTSGDYLYRKNADTWRFGTVNHGVYAPPDANAGAETLGSVHPDVRGYTPRNTPKNSFMELGTNCWRQGSTYFVAQGWISPMADPQNFALYAILDIWRPPNDATPLGAEVAFCVPSDRPFYSFPENDEKIGYVLSYRTAGKNDENKAVRLWTWNPDGGDDKNHMMFEWNVNTWDSGWAAFRIKVNTNRIEIAAVNRDNPSQVVGTPYDSSTDPNTTNQQLGKAYRGGYVLLGRGAAAQADRPTARFKSLVTIPKGGG